MNIAKSFNDKFFTYNIKEAEKTEGNEVVVEGTLSREGSKGKAFFEYTYGCDDEEEELHIKKKSSEDITTIINQKDLEDDIMKKIRTTVVKKGKKLRDPWLEGHDPLTPAKTDDDEDSEYEEEEEEEEEPVKTPIRRSRPNSGKSDKSNKSAKKAKSSDTMTPANKLTSLNLKVKSRQKQIEQAKAKRDKSEEEFKLNAHKLTDYASNNKGTNIGDVMKIISTLKSCKKTWANYAYEEEEDVEGHCLHDLANVLRSVADIVDAKNSDVEELQKEIEHYTAMWLTARRDHTAEQYKDMTGKYPTDMELTNMGL